MGVKRSLGPGVFSFILGFGYECLGVVGMDWTFLLSVVCDTFLSCLTCLALGFDTALAAD
jgi:phosphotransferase system  glucose/maltose/N-acetylglucosamine-specific IIC component